MNIEFKTKKLKKQCEDPKEAQKIYGSQMGIKLTLRVNEIRAAKSLDDIAKNSRVNGFHALDGDRAGEYSVYLVHPYRLIFSVKSDIDCNSEQLFKHINFVRIEEVKDYHGKNKRR